jgi:hypothetical protein
METKYFLLKRHHPTTRKLSEEFQNLKSLTTHAALCLLYGSILSFKEAKRTILSPLRMFSIFTNQR